MALRTWPMQDAKAHLSQLIRFVSDKGPQEITVHGRPVAVVVSTELFESWTKPKISLVEFMRASPLAHLPDDFEFERITGPHRPDIKL